MGRALPLGPLRCAHGYARETAATECPRCADHPGTVFLVVPIAGFVMVDVQLLPALWEPGRRRDG